MSIYKTMQDAATVASDAAEVASNFQNVPPALVNIGKDVVCAVYAQSVPALVKVKQDFADIVNAFSADAQAAQGAINKFNRDLDILIADFTD